MKHLSTDRCFFYAHFKGGIMNPRVEKLKQEREKNEKKIATLQARNKKIDTTILELENTDIIINLINWFEIFCMIGY